MRKIAILYDEDKKRFDAQAIASVLVPNSYVLSKDGSDLVEQPLFAYLLHSKFIRTFSSLKTYYLLDHTDAQNLPNMGNKYCSLHVTNNKWLALQRPRTFKYPKGFVYKQTVSMARARASLPVSKGTWIYVTDLEKSKKFIKENSNKGYTFLTVTSESDWFDSDRNIRNYQEKGNNDETLWSILMACNVIVCAGKTRQIYFMSGRQVLKPYELDDSVTYMPDLDSANKRIVKRNYPNRTRVIMNELAKYHPIGDRIKSVLI